MERQSSMRQPKQSDAEVDQVNNEIFTELGKNELTLDDVRAVVAARWGAA